MLLSVTRGCKYVWQRARALAQRTEPEQLTGWNRTAQLSAHNSFSDTSSRGIDSVWSADTAVLSTPRRHACCVSSGAAASLVKGGVPPLAAATLASAAADASPSFPAAALSVLGRFAAPRSGLSAAVAPPSETGGGGASGPATLPAANPSVPVPLWGAAVDGGCVLIRDHSFSHCCVQFRSSPSRASRAAWRVSSHPSI